MSFAHQPRQGHAAGADAGGQQPQQKDPALQVRCVCMCWHVLSSELCGGSGSCVVPALEQHQSMQMRPFVKAAPAGCADSCTPAQQLGQGCSSTHPVLVHSVCAVLCRRCLQPCGWAAATEPLPDVACRGGEPAGQPTHEPTQAATQDTARPIQGAVQAQEEQQGRLACSSCVDPIVAGWDECCIRGTFPRYNGSTLVSM